MRSVTISVALLGSLLAAGSGVAAPQAQRRAIRVVRANEDTALLDAGAAAGLQPGDEYVLGRKVTAATETGDGTMSFVRPVARCRIQSVEASSAVCQILSRRDDVRAGDSAISAGNNERLLAADAETRQIEHPAAAPAQREESADASVGPQLPLRGPAASELSLKLPATPSANVAAGAPAPLRPVASEVRTQFRVKYVAEGAVYLDGGRAAGLEEGHRLEVRRPKQAASETAGPEAPVAQLVVVSVAEASAVCEVRSGEGELREGDVAALVAEDVAALIEKRAASGQRRYLQVLTFSEGDPLEEEVRDSMPRPPSPAVNRARGRIGFDYSGVRSRTGGSSSSTAVGVVLRADVTRIAGTFWNFSGYWRGRLNSRSSGSGQTQTLLDLIQRTYHLQFDYVNPNSRWVAGFGRLYVPWASSLNTIDGGYFGRRLGRHAVTGLFAGSTPDPTSWNYNPNRRLAGVFVNFEGGHFQTFRYSSSIGGGASLLGGKLERPFGFVENSFAFGRKVTLYNSLEMDRPRLVAPGTRSTLGVARSFVTVRVQAHPRLALDLNHNFFRDFPTFDPQLVGTGLLDKLLFQGFSAGLRAELPGRISATFSAGRSSKSEDPRGSWNQLYGLTFQEIPGLHVRADLRYSRFDSAFGRGQYRSLAFSREIGEGFRWEITGGDQRFASPLTQQSRSRFVTAQGDWFIGRHYFLGTGLTVQRGPQNDYEQWFVNLGYRF